MSSPHTLIEKLRGAVVLAISPHPDDLALSAGGFAQRVATLARMVLVTPFTRSVWAPRLPESARSEANISELRARENAAYCLLLGAENISFDFPDAGLRGYDDSTERCESTRGDSVCGAVQQRLAIVHQVCRPAVVVGPLGIGGHVDHQVVRDALRAITTEEDICVWYEDLPYATDFTAGEIEDFVRATVPGSQPMIVELGDEIERKLSNLSVYQTQVRNDEVVAVRTHARRCAVDRSYAERLWVCWPPHASVLPVAD